MAGILIQVAGGTGPFRKFIERLAEPADRVLFQTNAAAADLTLPPDSVLILLPDYEAGELLIPPLEFDRIMRLRELKRQGLRAYLENYAAQDYLHSQVNAFQMLGREQYLFQEYIEFDGAILQARQSFCYPVSPAFTPIAMATVGDSVGTHRVFRPENRRRAVLYRHEDGSNFISAMLDFSAYDSRFMRPRADWKRLYFRIFGELTGKSEAWVNAAFEAAFPEYLTLSGNSDPACAVRHALKWHEASGLLRAPDGSAGMFEMIASNTLRGRTNLRTDAELLTGALFAAAGKKYGDPRLLALGKNLADFLLNRGVQLPNGWFKWFDHTDIVWGTDSSRDGLALWQLYRSTGDARYRAAANRLADGMLRSLAANGLCTACCMRGEPEPGRPGDDNPAYYGEMVCFLLKFSDTACTRAALRILDRIGEKFPEVTPVGFSDNLTFCRYLLMLAAAQTHTERDFSEPINRMIAFFAALQEPSGGIREAAIRLDNHPVEAGVAIGDGSDSIMDLLYCGNYVLAALSLLRKLPPGQRGTIDLARADEMYRALRDLLLKIQICSDDPRFDGGWMRAFDMDRREYYGLNKDMDWGAYTLFGMRFYKYEIFAKSAWFCYHVRYQR